MIGGLRKTGFIMKRMVGRPTRGLSVGLQGRETGAFPLPFEATSGEAGKGLHLTAQKGPGRWHE